MKQLPDEKTLLELLQLAKDAEQKAREMSDIGEVFVQKWQHRLATKRAAAQKQGN